MEYFLDYFLDGLINCSWAAASSKDAGGFQRVGPFQTLFLLSEENL